ncbi:MAG: hypothetical protein IT423_12100 [Pirellulaceae bacterium]|nr:hypothetical protein [Pirellulaceae bacterium]
MMSDSFGIVGIAIVETGFDQLVHDIAITADDEQSANKIDGLVKTPSSVVFVPRSAHVVLLRLGEKIEGLCNRGIHGPAAASPVLEGNAMLLNDWANIDAFPKRFAREDGDQS